MAAVMLDIEANASRQQPEPDGQRQTVPPPVDHEDKQHVQRREARQEEGGFQVELPTIARPPACGSEILLDSPPELPLEGLIVSEFQAWFPVCAVSSIESLDIALEHAGRFRSNRPARPRGRTPSAFPIA